MSEEGTKKWNLSLSWGSAPNPVPASFRLRRKSGRWLVWLVWFVGARLIYKFTCEFEVCLIMT